MHDDQPRENETRPDAPGRAALRVEEEISAQTKQRVREAGRRKAGVAGAVFAGVMLSLQEIYEGPLPEELTIVADADGSPGDLDADGMTFTIEKHQVSAPPIERDETISE